MVNLEHTLADEGSQNDDINNDIDRTWHCNSKLTDKYCHPYSGSCGRCLHAVNCTSVNEFNMNGNVTHISMNLICILCHLCVGIKMIKLGIPLSRAGTNCMLDTGIKD